MFNNKNFGTSVFMHPKTITIPREFSLSLRYKIWTAFRFVYLSQGKKRDKVAQLVEDTINNALDDTDFVDPQGKKIEYLDTYPTPQTYYNFYRSGIGNSKTDDGAGNISNNISSSPRTLRLIYAFLLVLDEGKHRRIFAEDQNEGKWPIENLTDDFIICETSELNLEFFAIMQDSWGLLSHPEPKVRETKFNSMLKETNEYPFPTTIFDQELRCIVFTVKRQKSRSLTYILHKNTWLRFLSTYLNKNNILRINHPYSSTPIENLKSEILKPISSVAVYPNKINKMEQSGTFEVDRQSVNIFSSFYSEYDDEIVTSSIEFNLEAAKKWMSGTNQTHEDIVAVKLYDRITFTDEKPLILWRLSNREEFICQKLISLFNS